MQNFYIEIQEINWKVLVYTKTWGSVYKLNRRPRHPNLNLTWPNLTFTQPDVIGCNNIQSEYNSNQ